MHNGAEVDGWAGNLTKDPELAFQNDGTVRTTFAVAITRRTTFNGEQREETIFFDCVAFRDLAEHIAESLTKGARVIISGRLKSNDWVDREGNKRYGTQLVVDDIGVSLKWATCKIQKATRVQPAQSGQPQAAPQQNQMAASQPPF